MDIPRSAGAQLHPTSLPSGRLGSEAYAFVDWLHEAGQSWWQMLPLGPPDEHGSPYKAHSAFSAWSGLLAEPDAPVSEEEEQAFREREWAALRAYAAERGVRLIGDVPIYVAPGSADHVAHPELFRGGVQSGAPPDRFTEAGQLWGNPLYDWPAMRRRRYRWWTERFRRVFELFDVARIDHFRGFVAYWSVPEGARDARGGTWVRGPGRAPFDAAARELGELRLIAEDLGVITPPVKALRDALGLPGMVVLQFGYDPDDPHSPHRVGRHPRHSVAYTGTHDNDTILGWYASLQDDQRAMVHQDLRAYDLDAADPGWDLVRLNLASKAELAMIQIQDVLGLGSEARMNLPGRQGGPSWRWTLEPGQLTGEHAARLRAATEGAGRLPG